MWLKLILVGQFTMTELHVYKFLKDYVQSSVEAEFINTGTNNFSKKRSLWIWNSRCSVYKLYIWQHETLTLWIVNLVVVIIHGTSCVRSCLWYVWEYQRQIVTFHCPWNSVWCCGLHGNRPIPSSVPSCSCSRQTGNKHTCVPICYTGFIQTWRLDIANRNNPLMSFPPLSHLGSSSVIDWSGQWSLVSDEMLISEIWPLSFERLLTAFGSWQSHIKRPDIWDTHTYTFITELTFV